MRPAGVRAALAACVGLLLLVGACSGGGDVPEGFTTAREGGARFAFPEGWEVASEPGRNVVALGATGPGGLRENAILQIDRSFSGDFDLYLDGLGDLANAEFADREVTEEAIEVPGAERATLFHATYRQPAEGDPRTLVEVRQFDLFSLSPDQTLHYLQVGAPAELFDEARLRAIVESLSLDA